MPILVDRTDSIIIQGITGNIGRSFARRMVSFGSPIRGGVTPGKSGQTVEGLPVCGSVSEAVRTMNATHSLIVVPPFAVRDAVMEAADAGIALSIVYTEGVPVHDAMEACHYARARSMILCGPNSAGIVSPGRANLSDLNDENLLPGPVGVVSKSGTLTYEILLSLRQLGIGASTIVCLGGDPVVGLDYRMVLQMFEADPVTRAIVLIGEIGGEMEIHAAEVIKSMTKPVVAYITGQSAPEGKRMGHAGALISSKQETAAAKMAALRAAGALVGKLVTDIAGLTRSIL